MAPSIDGRVAKFTAYLDHVSTQGLLPTGENAKGTCGAMRVSGWAWGTSESLLFESLFYWRSDDVIARHLDAFTMSKGVGNEGRARSWLLTEDDLRENLDDHSWRSKVSGVVFRDETGHGDIVRAAPKTAIRTFPVKIGGRTVKVPTKMPPLRGLKLKNRRRLSRLAPEDRLVLQLCDRLDRDRLFPVDRALLVEAGIPKRATRVFVFDDWQHPDYEQRASASPDIVAMVRAVVGRAPLRRLPGKANCDWRRWLDSLLATVP